MISLIPVGNTIFKVVKNEKRKGILYQDRETKFFYYKDFNDDDIKLTTTLYSSYETVKRIESLKNQNSLIFYKEDSEFYAIIKEREKIGWLQSTTDVVGNPIYKLLLPDGRVYLAGETLSLAQKFARENQELF